MQKNTEKSSNSVIVERDIMVPMRDSVYLATDLYFPAHNGNPVKDPLPVLLHRTPYNKVEVETSIGYCQWFASRGYITAIQDCRGCFNSEGDVAFIEPEAEDGFDTLQWLGEQPWCNGNVGTWGTSWAGWTQTAAAALGAKTIASMIPNMSGAIGHESSVRQGGALELRFLAWAFWHSASNTQKNLKPNPHIDAALNLGGPSFTDWLTRLPLRKGQTQLSLVPPYEKWALKLQSEADFSDYWKKPAISPGLFWDDWPDVPILLVGGWYDSYTRSTFRNHIGLVQRGFTVKTLVGPWVHGHHTVEQSFSGDVEFGKHAVLNFRDLHEKWFDQSLRNQGTAIDDRAPLQLFVMGGGGGQRTTSGRLYHGGCWREELEWPLARTQFTNFYLQTDGMLTKDPPHDEDSHTTYQFDPDNPVPSIGGNVSSLSELGPMPSGVGEARYAPRGSRVCDIMPNGGFDQVEGENFWGCEPPFLPLGSRPDVLVFETEPLAKDTEVTGPIEVTLWVSSTAPDTDFTAKVIDRYPPSPFYPYGYSLNLTDSIMRLRYRNGPDKAELLPPNNIAKITITLYPTSNLFSSGHRIRLDISSSNFPRFDVNPNTGDTIGSERRRNLADNTVHHNRDYPSHVKLPIIPNCV